MGHDPLRVGTAARARGLTPNIHLTCVNGDRQALRKTLEDLHALGIQNVFALTGDFPKAQAGAGPAEAAFDLDSVQLVRLIAEMRRAGMPFHVAVAVSPFKYVEADCMYQYLKLEKKIAAGADLAITQVGWDAEKFAELMRYLAERAHRYARPRQRVRARAESRRADGDGPAPRLLGLARAARDGAQGSHGEGRRAARAPGAGRPHGRGAPRPRLCRRVHRRHARCRPRRVDHSALGGAGAAVGSAGRGAPLRRPRGILSVRPAPHPLRRACASRSASASCRGSST